MKQSTMRSPRLNKRPDRLLYSGNMPATPTKGSAFSRCPAFRWQLLHDIWLGANSGASCGVLVKSLKPHLISFESFELSSVLSSSGFFGTTQAVAIVVREETNGPLSLMPKIRPLLSSFFGCGLWEHAARNTAQTQTTAIV